MSSGITLGILKELTAVTVLIFLIRHAESKCNRDESKLVRSLIKMHIEPLLEEAHVLLPSTCPLNLLRDVLKAEEDVKLKETASQWRCNLCGKTFYEERFLSLHFDNRHPDLYKETETTVCLADYCDIFRCDVISGYRKPHYWDQALCNLESLKKRREKCEVVVTNCLPTFLVGEEKNEFARKVHDLICDKLTCENFWHVPEREYNPLGAAIYIALAIVLGVILSIYYYIAYSHFYTEESLLDTNEAPRQQRKLYRKFDGGQEIRQRVGPS